MNGFFGMIELTGATLPGGRGWGISALGFDPVYLRVGIVGPLPGWEV